MRGPVRRLVGFGGGYAHGRQPPRWIYELDPSRASYNQARRTGLANLSQLKLQLTESP